MPLGRIGDDLADVVLRVEPAVVPLPSPFGLQSESIRRATSRFRELGILLDLDPPALVLGEMPVERVHLVDGQEVDRMLDEILAEEVAAFV